MSVGAHEIGNLTIFGPGDNDGLGNKSFADKLDVLKNSKLRLTREVDTNTNWTSALVNTRTERLVQMALSHFSNSGTHIDSNTRTVYEVIYPRSYHYVHDMNMGFIHSAATRTRCRASRYVPLG